MSSEAALTPRALAPRDIPPGITFRQLQDEPSHLDRLPAVIDQRRGYVNASDYEATAIDRIICGGGLVIDAGGGARFTKGLAQYQSSFRDITYKTLDIATDTQPDIVGDIQNMPFEDESVDAFICRSVLEHVPSPERAVAEMRRCLKPGGLLLLTLPSIYPYHSRPDSRGYPDLWRFFDDTVEMLLDDFHEVNIARAGGPATALIYFSPFLNRHGKRLLRFAGHIDDFVSRRRPRRHATFLLVFAQK